MLKTATWILVLAMACVAMPAVADQDLDNNGIVGDETFVPGTYEGETDRDETVVFPTTSDNWSVYYYPYWWHVGDTVWGTHDVDLETTCHADVNLKLSYNSLNGSGYVDLDFRIDGVTVGSLHILPSHGTGYVAGSFDFAPVSPPFELRYYETNQVVGGGGSVSLDEAGLSSVTFSDGPSPVEESTWGAIKALYR